MYFTKEINGVEICYDEGGTADRPALVLLTGWAHDIRLYDELLPYLSSKYWVIRVSWRGHGICRDEIDDFGVDEQISDTVGLLDALDVEKFYLVAHSHGGWVALGLAAELGAERISFILMIDQVMTSPPAAFAAGLQMMQSKEKWKAARQGLFDNWAAGSDIKAVEDHFTYSFGGFGFKMWALSCRVIADAYDKHGSPMQLMEKIESPPLIRHVFSHPLNDPEYRELHLRFSQKHAWFSYADLEGRTHFPSLELPSKVADHIDELVRETS